MGVLDKTHAYRKTLQACLLLGVAALIGIAWLVPVGPAALFWVAINFGMLGFALTPVVPVSFETAVVLMSPGVRETVLSGICMGSGQIMSIVVIGLLTIIRPLSLHLALWLCPFGLIIAAGTMWFGGFDNNV